MADLTGQTVGKYRITAYLGRGGMAEVYKAYQPGLDRYVALKVMRSHLADDQDFIHRFEREAAATARLRHPHIVQVYDFDVQGDRHYMVTELVEGPTLKAELAARRLAGRPFSLAETTRIFTALASAIDYAHTRGMIHRDLKPSNVMFTVEGQAVLTDFGIARMLGDSHITVTGAVIGTPAYMSPEQGQGACCDERSDIYSLGVILYEMVTGRVPFEGDTPFATIMKHVTEPLPPPTSIKPDLPRAVERVLVKALSKNPDARYQRAGEMAQTLRQAAGVTPDQTLAALPVMPIAPTRPSPETRPKPGLERAPAPSPTDIVAAPGTTEAISAAAQVATATARPAATGLSIAGLPVLPMALGAGVILLACLIALALLGRRALEQVGAQEMAVRATQTALAAIVLTQPTDTPTPAPIIVPTNTRTPPTPAPTQPSATSTPLPATHTPAPPAPPARGPGRASPTPTPLPTTPMPALVATPTPSPTSSPSPTPLPAAPTATSAPRGPALTGKLAFSLPQGTSYKVYVVEVGPNPPADLYASVGNARQPDLSHDGEWLLVNGTGGGLDAIARLTSAGYQASAITCPATTAESHRPVWSPDDRRMAFDGLLVDPGRPQIYIQRADEVDCELVDNRLQIGGGYVTDPNGLYPVWGPDDRIYFRSCATWDPVATSTCGLWSAQTDGGGVSQWTDNPNHLPTDVNRERLLFMSSQEGNWEVYAVGLRGGAPQNLTNNPNVDVWGTLSPDGRAIAFLSNRSGRWAIWLANADGSQPREWLPINPDWGEVDPERIAQERMSWSE